MRQRNIIRCRLSTSDRGAGTLLGLFLVVVVLVLAGVVVEAGNLMSIRGHATMVAQQAARAGADQLDLNVLRTTGQVRLDPPAAQAAALAYLAQIGETGTAVATATATEVRVTVTVTKPGILVPVLGFESHTVQSTATAAPLTG